MLSCVKASFPENFELSLPIQENDVIENEGFTYVDVASGNGVYVAVAVSNAMNAIVTSTDGNNWNYAHSSLQSTGNTYTTIAFGDGLFIVLCGNSNMVLTSTDGTTWTAPVLATSFSAFWHKLRFGNGVFMAVGDGKTILKSIDAGTTWTTVSAGSLPDKAKAITYGNNLFLVMSYNSNSVGAFSLDDGETWNDMNSVTAPIQFRNQGWIDVSFGGNSFVAVSEDSATNPQIIYNRLPDDEALGVWVQAILPDTASVLTWNGIAFGEGAFVAVGRDIFPTADDSLSIKSTNGQDWTSVTTPTFTYTSDDFVANFQSVVFGNDQFVAVGGGPKAGSLSGQALAMFTPTESEGLSAGAIVGIAIGSVVLLTIGGYAGFKYWKSGKVKNAFGSGVV